MDRTVQITPASVELSSGIGKITKRWVRRAAIAAIAIYGINALILFCFSPHGNPSGEESYLDSRVQLLDSVSVGYGPFEVEAAGYVNMASAENSFYISDALREDHSKWENTAYRHEYFHLIQRELVAEAAGGYPSYGNPFQSFVYYAQILRLNGDLATLMPEPGGSMPLTGGLESSADCYAQPNGSDGSPARFTGVYIAENLCDPAQVWVVDQMAQGRWPAAPSETEALPEVFVEGGFVGKASWLKAKDK